MFTSTTSILSTLVGLLSLGSAVQAANFNPTIEDIVSAIAHSTPQTRSLGGPEPILTNAERFARGLPPARPAPMRMARSLRAHHDARIERRTGGSAIPLPHKKGAIHILNEDTNAPLGYLSRVLNANGQFANTVPTSLDISALQVEIPGDVYLNGGSFFNLGSSNTASGFPLVGGTKGLGSTNENMGTGSYNYAFFTEVNASPAQSTGQTPGNSFSSITGVSQPSQSAIWSYDPLTKALTISWTNPNKNPEFSVDPQAGLYESTFFWTADIEAFKTEYGTPTKVSYTFSPLL